MLRRILVVDDDPAMRGALADALAAAGYEPRPCASGAEAAARLAEERLDLVISDLRLADIDGLELLKRSAPGAARPPFIMISGYATVPDAVAAMKLGAFDFLVKPFSYRELTALIEEALGGGAPGAEAEADEGEIVTADPRMRSLLRFAAEVAKSQATVLIRGETGTGKELLAHYIHRRSRRRDGPFVAINCAALPEGLLESEMFGYERGAFTGALATKAGKFELAHRGTLLLDEVSEMPLGLQAKLLRVLQEREVDRLGGKRPIRVDVRVIATTNRDLQEMVKRGAFREDLFYRLNVIPLRLPPLRDRRGDIEPLARAFFARQGYRQAALSESAVRRLSDHPWPGNVRELFNVLERAAILSGRGLITAENLLFEAEWAGECPAAPERAEATSVAVERPGVEEPAGSLNVREAEKRLIRRALREARSNRTRAAALLGISVRTLRNKLKQYREEL
jgi:DNA-binding NtrC family response regulator